MFGEHKRTKERIEQEVAGMVTSLDGIYKNKSSDEYKMSGDITKSRFYDDIERMVANLSTLKGYPKVESNDIHSMFNVLHRPVFKKMTTEFLHEPNDRNIIFTAVFTVGYRVLVGELSRIYSSTEATDKGIVYKPDKMSKKYSMNKFIKVYKNDLESRIDTDIRTKLETGVQQEGWLALKIGSAAVGLMKFIKNHELTEWAGVITVLFDRIFGSASELNPVSYIDDVLSSSYDKKVASFENASAMYQATKDAYDEYMKIPEAQRNKKVESNYIKNMEKYNIQMKNLKAKIDHYDKRAREESRELIDSMDVSSSSSTNNTKTTNTSTSTNNDDFDF